MMVETLPTNSLRLSFRIKNWETDSPATPSMTMAMLTYSTVSNASKDLNGDMARTDAEDIFFDVCEGVLYLLLIVISAAEIFGVIRRKGPPNSW
jgi:hypothetical protein